MPDQQFCLRWNNHQNTLVSVFDSLLESGILVDCTLAAEGQFLRAHKVVLSACSPFLSDLLRQHYEKHPILIMKDVKFNQLKAMLDYMYRGEVNISQDQLGTFLKAAESLQIKGLSESAQGSGSTASDKNKPAPVTGKAPRMLPKAHEDDSLVRRPTSTSPTPRKRKRRRHSGSGDDESLVVGDSVVNISDSVPEASVPTSSSKTCPTANSVNVSQVTSPSVTARGEESVENDPTSSVSEAPNSVTVSVRNEGLPLHSLSPTDSGLVQPKTEYLEVDSVEDLTMDDDNVDLSQAGPSQGDNSSGGFPWHIERTDESFLTAQDPHGSHRNAQDTWFPIVPTAQEATPPQYGPYSCPRCGRKYAVLYTLERHLRYECGVDKQFGCPVCQRRFSRRDVLRTHQKNSGHFVETETTAKTFMDMIALSATQRKA